MVFKELEIQGFKSFPDKVKIRFDEGVTGVVGPNGSGKSNLSDAVRWVLGETSTRQLRAAGKMEDVIFGGTRRRGAMGFAQVRLTLDNSAHTLDLDADEVTIGRKYYRSGESEYSINGQVCRLRDVYELLLDTGIGRDGYSVIGQGRVAEIVAAKSGERREIFEEACGIAKYRYRKNEAERRLAAAADNLERLRDILGELESRVGPLEKESEKARKFLELSARRKTLEVTLWTDGVHRAREAVRQQVRDYETAQADYERFDRETKAAEAEAEEIRMQAQQLTITVERLNGDIRSITEQISGSESRIAVLENDIARNEESAADLQREIAAGEQDRSEAAAALERHRAVAKSMEAAGQKLAAELAALNEEMASLTSENNASGARRDTLRAEVAELTAKRTEAQVAKAAAEAASETARQRLPDLEQAAETLAVQRDDAKQDLADTIQYQTMLEQNEKQLANIRAGLELKLKNRRAALDEADTAEQRLGRELDAARQRLSVLRELEKNMDGYQNSVKTVMRAASARRLRGVIGPVSAILEVEPGREVAIETALGGALQNIVVRTKPPPRRALLCCGARTRAAPPSCRWIPSSPACSGGGCPARQSWRRLLSKQRNDTPISSPTCWAASSWWTTSTRPPGWPGTTATTTRWSRWTGRSSTRAAVLQAAASSGQRGCSPASRRWRSCGSRLQSSRKTVWPRRRRRTSSKARRTRFPQS